MDEASTGLQQTMLLLLHMSLLLLLLLIMFLVVVVVVASPTIDQLGEVADVVVVVVPVL